MVKPSPDRSAIVRLHKAARPPVTIAKHLGIHRSVVYRTLQRYRHLGGLQDRRRSGRLRTARTPKVVEAVRKRIARNATRSFSTMTRDMGISRMSMERVVHEDLKMYPCRTRKAAILSASNRVKKCRLLLLRTTDKKGRVVHGSELPDFISAEEWPASSPDLNPLDYNLWSYLESKACATPHPNLVYLKAALIREWDEIDDALLRRTHRRLSQATPRCRPRQRWPNREVTYDC
ncbi:hypothetical protein COOONC_21127 [Cooperia oncophora]